MCIADVDNSECEEHRAQEWQDYEVYAATKRKAPHDASEDDNTENTSPFSTPPPKKKDCQTHDLPKAIKRAQEISGLQNILQHTGEAVKLVVFPREQLPAKF